MFRCIEKVICLLPSEFRVGIKRKEQMNDLRENRCLLLVYTTQVNSAFGARRLASSEVISQALFTSTAVHNCSL